MTREEIIKVSIHRYDNMVFWVDDENKTWIQKDGEAAREIKIKPISPMDPVIRFARSGYMFAPRKPDRSGNIYLIDKNNEEIPVDFDKPLMTNVSYDAFIKFVDNENEVYKEELDINRRLDDYKIRNNLLESHLSRITSIVSSIWTKKKRKKK